MKGFVTNIEQATLENTNFRHVLYTAKNCQLVLMSVPCRSDIGEEVHTGDQFIRVEAGEGKSILDGIERDLHAGSVIIIPAGVRHNITNTSENDTLKLYTLYAPPHHRDAVTHVTKEDAEKDTEHFEGVTTDDLNS